MSKYPLYDIINMWYIVECKL